ncbi:hypothetical protein E2F46_17330 [Luteimonas aestuarii]|uniref:Uncharacterized protein n=1 Tax=Luteimonas aestuarii TaxID=453837 RepID=A0A4R5TQ80_9GAMM|nr:hypothetical protein [Luteimonas aestuarii]TDK18274.1 hypothetical protein E2F46_17330 [Luteimonas aestuarii]
MDDANKRVHQLIVDFGQDTGVTPEMVVNLRAAITSSPHLVDRMSKAAEEGHLLALRPQEASLGAGAAYHGSTKSISIPLDILAPEESRNASISNELTFRLGHEVQHGFNHARMRQGIEAAAAEMVAVAHSPGAEKDYTEAALQWQQARREDEASAHIEGWNVAISQLRHSGNDVTFQQMRDVYGKRASDFIERDEISGQFRPKSGLTFNDDLTLSATPENVETVAQQFYDSPSRGVGHTWAGYSNYDGASIISYAVQSHLQYARPGDELVLDFKRLGIEEKYVEINGLDFGRYAASSPEIRYVDISDGERREGIFDHTKDGPNQNQHVDNANQLNQQTQEPSGEIGFSHPRHPDHPLYRNVQRSMQDQLPEGAQVSEDRLAQLTLAAKEARFRPGEHIDAFVGETSVSLRGEHPTHLTQIDLTTPPPTAQQSAQLAGELDREQARQAEQYAQQQAAQQQNVPVMQH